MQVLQERGKKKKISASGCDAKTDVSFFIPKSVVWTKMSVFWKMSHSKKK